MPARINHYGINESIASQKRYRKQLKRERRLLQELEPPEPTPVDLSGLDQLIAEYRTPKTKEPTMQQDQNTRLVWIDVETCGLDPQINPLLEINLIISRLDATYKPEDVYHQCIQLPENTMLSSISEWALEHHTANGLLNACRGENKNDPAATLKEADTSLTVWLDSYKNLTLHPAGTNVDFDLRYLKHNLAISIPSINRWSHRHLDLSTFRLTDMALGQDPYDSSHTTTHRGLTCIRRDIEDYKRYMNRLDTGWKKAA